MRYFSEYKCVYCERAFARSNGRTKHYALEHKDIHQAFVKDDSRPEGSTNAKLSSNDAIQRLSKNDGRADVYYETDDNQKSSVMRRYQCGTCLQLFTARKHLKQHETLHTGERRKSNISCCCHSLIKFIMF